MEVAVVNTQGDDHGNLPFHDTKPVNADYANAHVGPPTDLDFAKSRFVAITLNSRSTIWSCRPIDLDFLKLGHLRLDPATQILGSSGPATFPCADRRVREAKARGSEVT